MIFIFFPQLELAHQVDGLYFGNSILINSVNSTSPYTEGQMTSTEKGDVYVVWVDKNNIYFSSSPGENIKFTSPIVLGSNNTVLSSPQLAATEKGDVYVVWVDKKKANGDTNISFVTSNTSGNDFTIRKNLRANNLLSFSPQLAATEKGDVYVVWVDKNNSTGASNIIFRASNDNGNNFERSVRLNRISNQTTLLVSPQIAATENGNLFAIWSENSVQFKEILDSEDIFGRTVSISSNVILPTSVQIDVTENGNIYLAWSEKRGNATKDIAFVFKKISEFYFDRN